MPWHDHYFILDENHQPKEVSHDEWVHWADQHQTIKKTQIGPNARVWTYFSGMTDDVTMPGPPKFIHHISGPGLHGKSADSPTYDEALARHERIAEWVRKKVEKVEGRG
jgi:hypothetical protein